MHSRTAPSRFRQEPRRENRERQSRLIVGGPRSSDRPTAVARTEDSLRAGPTAPASERQAKDSAVSNQSTNEASAPRHGDRVQYAPVSAGRATTCGWPRPSTATPTPTATSSASGRRARSTEPCTGAPTSGRPPRRWCERSPRCKPTGRRRHELRRYASWGPSTRRAGPTRSLGKANRGAKRAAERLTRAPTRPPSASPSISVMLWDALDVLGDRARDITDLHWRHGLASDEIAAATGESIFRVDDIIRKAPRGLAGRATNPTALGRRQA